jgi:hypothetical protein
VTNLLLRGTSVSSAQPLSSSRRANVHGNLWPSTMLTITMLFLEFLRPYADLYFLLFRLAFKAWHVPAASKLQPNMNLIDAQQVRFYCLLRYLAPG